MPKTSYKNSLARRQQLFVFLLKEGVKTVFSKCLQKLCIFHQQQTFFVIFNIFAHSVQICTKRTNRKAELAKWEKVPVADVRKNDKLDLLKATKLLMRGSNFNMPRIVCHCPPTLQCETKSTTNYAFFALL